MTANTVELDALAAGDDVATDLIATKHYQQVKLVDGTIDGTTPIASGGGVEAGALRVTVASDSTGVLTVDGTVTANPASGTIDTVTNLAQMGGAALNMGEGIIATGTQRVTLATDDDAVASLAAIEAAVGGSHTDDAAFTLGTSEGVMMMGFAGTQSVDANDAGAIAMETNGSVHTVEKPQTSGGISTVYRDEDIDETAVALKASAGQIYWIHVINLDATPVYLHFYDVAQGSVTVGTTGELCSFAVPSSGDANGAGFTMPFPHGIQFSTAITVACTTAISGSAGPGLNEVILNVGYE